MNGLDRLLTIAIAAYNAEDTLWRALDSLGTDEELMRDLDIIIVDDGSDDETVSTGVAYAEKFPDIVRVISKANGGYGSAVNTALYTARGLYFKLLDADDSYDRQGFRELVMYLRECVDDPGKMPDLIITPLIYERLSPDGGITEEPAERHRGMRAGEPVRLEEADLTEGLMMFEICVRTDVLRVPGVRLTEHCYYTDNEFVMASLLYAADAAWLPKPVYRYSLGVPGQSMSVAGRRLHADDKIRAALGTIDMYEKRIIVSAISGTRDLLARELISTMIREVYVTFMIMENPADNRSGLREFDDRLRAEHPLAWRISGRSRLVTTVRRSGPALYNVLCRRILESEMRRTEPLAAGLLPHEENRDGETGEEPYSGGGFGSGGAGNSANNASGAEAKRGKLLPAAEYIAALCMLIQCRTIFMHLKDIGMIVNRLDWLVLMIALALCVTLGHGGRARAEAGSEGEGRIHGSGAPDPQLKFTAQRIRQSAGIHLPGAFITRIPAGAPGSIALAVIYSGIFILFNPVNILRVIRCAAAVLVMMLLLRSRGGRDKSRRILLCFSDIVLVTAGITLIFWTLSSVLHILPCTGYIWTDWTKTGGYDRIPTFLGIYYETQGTGWSLITARNTGIFTEAPMSGFCYSLALIIDLYLRPEIDESRQAEAGASSGNRHRLLRMCILTISILSTFSLVSYIMLLLILALKLAEGSKTGAAYGTGKAAELRRAGAANANGAVTGNRRAPAPDDTGTVNLPGRDRAARLAGTVLTSAFAVFIIYFAYVKLTYGSGSIRLNDFAVGFRAWLAHPLMGGGFENLDYLRQFMPEWRMELDTGFSNSPMEILAQGGLYLALPYAYSLAAGLIRSIRMRDMRMLSFIILFTYLFTFTVVPYQYITFAALIYIASADDAGRPTAC